MLDVRQNFGRYDRILLMETGINPISEEEMLEFYDLTQVPIEIGASQVILHTTRSMEIAWGLYENMGFLRSPDLDFSQGELSVYGFRLIYCKV